MSCSPVPTGLIIIVCDFARVSTDTDELTDDKKASSSNQSRIKSVELLVRSIVILGEASSS